MLNKLLIFGLCFSVAGVSYAQSGGGGAQGARKKDEKAAKVGLSRAQEAKMDACGGYEKYDHKKNVCKIDTKAHDEHHGHEGHNH